MDGKKASEIDRLVSGYEDGRIDRRQLLAGLALLVSSAPSANANPQDDRTEPAFVGQTLNHVTLSVSDVEASKRFYSSILGVKEISRQRNGVNLGLGTSFLGLYSIKEAPRVNHFCIGLDEFHVPIAAERLRQYGIEPRVRKDKPEVYFEDPDGITVQLENRNYRG